MKISQESTQTFNVVKKKEKKTLTNCIKQAKKNKTQTV